LPFFHIFQIISLFSSIFSLSFHYFLLDFPNLFTIRLTYLPYFPNHFTIQLIFLPYFPMFSMHLSETSIDSYDISFMYKLPWNNCNIVECGIKNHQPNPLFTKTYTYLPIYLHVYQNYRFYSIFASYLPMLMSFKFQQSNLHNSLIQFSIFRVGWIVKWYTISTQRKSIIN
jgi:hypothetical protein